VHASAARLTDKKILAPKLAAKSTRRAFVVNRGRVYLYLINIAARISILCQHV